MGKMAQMGTNFAIPGSSMAWGQQHTIIFAKGTYRSMDSVKSLNKLHTSNIGCSIKDGGAEKGPDIWLSFCCSLGPKAR